MHQHLRLVEIGTEIERDGEVHLTVAGGLRRHVKHVFDPIHFLLDRDRHSLGHRNSVGTWITRVNHDRGRRDIGELRYRQLEQRDGADKYEKDRNDRCENRPVNEIMRQLHLMRSSFLLLGRRFFAAGLSRNRIGSLCKTCHINLLRVHLDPWLHSLEAIYNHPVIGL